MSIQPYLGQIHAFAFGFAPKGWAQCNGQLLPINQNQALFALLGTTYGGNGQTNFALPDLRGRSPIHAGSIPQGSQVGSQAVTLTAAQTGAHTVYVSGQNALAGAPAGRLPAQSNAVRALGPAPTAGTALAPEAVGATTTGSSQAHTNMAPYTVLVYCIALQGVFPSQT